MTHVALRENENVESLLARFRMAVQHAGTMSDLRDHRFFRSKGEKARIAARRGAKRAARRERLLRHGRR